MIKALLLDVDGTLLSFETHKVSQSSMDALKKVHDSGIGHEKLFSNFVA